ncbi:hypothetical protein JR316_0006226 [Psilocybe cubensis]|uniref:Uncharacterized protein n=2 Tax=Psilocybe cubensis TaxID=181762 RepID=A0ACB8H396_PSICU|nr:hypothetical protein JR316_0006226 [Psilocybe cubensis]KAH9481699.1 hypothetical protein JR316_0006226 [Psilocybe cubensis]
MEKAQKGGLESTPAPEHELPSYTTAQNEQKKQDEGAGPSNSGLGLGKEHHKYLETAKGKKWLSMFVKSRATNPTSLPVFFEGDIISGRVELDIDKAESSKGISITIQGGTTFVGQEEEIFLKEEKSLWTGSKLKPGKQSWPFKFVLPKEVTIKDAGTFRIPPHYTERASPAYIDYKLIVTVKRGFLKVNQTLVTSFGYQPVTVPEQPSPLRRIAYSEGSPLIGPEGDPEGWRVLPTLKIKGTLFNTKEVEVDCTLAIAKPLSYALGSPIPLLITFSGDNPQALDLLANQNAIQLRLRRGMATGSDAIDDNGIRRTDNHFVEDCGGAYFWPSREGADEPNRKVLQGELEVVKTLKPSFKFPKVTIRYSLDLLPFSASGFVMNETVPGTVLLKETVTIATRQILGLNAHSYAPPGYEKPQNVDYNKSLGLLENGNQRFLGHHHR